MWRLIGIMGEPVADMACNILSIVVLDDTRAGGHPNQI